jgi:hypothetical protein
MHLWIYLAIAIIGFVSGLFFKAPLLIAESAALVGIAATMGFHGGLPIGLFLQYVVLALVLLQAMYLLGVIGNSFRRRNWKKL